MIRILIIQENGRHEKNRHFRECFCMQRSLKKLGHNVDVWGLGHDTFEATPDWNSYDLILNLENYDMTGWTPDISLVTNPKKFLWSFDAHCRGIKPFLDTYHDGKYDLILQAIEDYVDENSVWFPNCYDHTLIKPSASKTTFIGFCGSLLNREQILNFLVDKYGLKKDIWVLGDDMVQAVSSYRIHFNINLANDINGRSFETLGCGAMLLTNYNPQYEKLGFIDGANCMMYENIDELRSKIETCRLDADMVASIAEAGQDLAKKHTFDERAARLITIYEKII
jgi:hypothetical protein